MGSFLMHSRPWRKPVVKRTKETTPSLYKLTLLSFFPAFGSVLLDPFQFLAGDPVRNAFDSASPFGLSGLIQHEAEPTLSDSSIIV